MSGNTYGKLFTVTTAGESHGPALVAIVDGCPPGLELSLEDLQRDLDRRKPGTSRHVTQSGSQPLVRFTQASALGFGFGTSHTGLLAVQAYEKLMSSSPKSLPDPAVVTA